MTNPLEPSHYTVTCPKCGANSDFEGWPVIPNVFLPDVTDALIEGSLFEYDCTSCGYRDLAVYRCLYHDIPNAAFVLLEPDPASRDDAIRILREKTRDNGGKDDDVPRHTGRLVKHPDELSEKARILDADLDDCAIELMKLNMHTQLVSDDPLFEALKIYFTYAEDGLLHFEAGGYEDGTIVALRALYDEQVIELMLNPPEIEDFVVDQTWAFKHMAKMVVEGI